MAILVVYSALFSGVLFAVLFVWRSTAQETPQERADRASDDLSKTIDNLVSGKPTPGASTAPAIPWVADNAVIVALLVFVTLCIVARLYVFMCRLEDRTH